MPISPVRQITPPLSRVWLYGGLATLLSMLVNYGFLWLTENLFEVELLVPKGLWNSDLTLLTTSRVIVATGLAGLFALAAASFLAKLVIGPRTWCLILGFGVGLTSTYGAITLPNVVVSVHVALSVFHILTTFIIVPAVAVALTIHDSDLAHADARYHEHLDSRVETFEPTVSDVQPLPTEIAPEPETAPQPSPEQPVRVRRFQSSKILGTSESEALAAILEAGMNYRIAIRDGIPEGPAGEPDDNRITLIITNGIVTSARPG